MTALSTFLLDDFSSAYLGLAQGARNHLNRFQGFLHDFYTDKFGYWPPPKNASPFPKALYKSMFYDFKSLYDLLADTESYNDITSQKPASGGICIFQNVDQFNNRHKFPAQDHPLPLLPRHTGSQTPSKSLTSASYYSKSRDTSADLLTATNSLDANAYNTKIIQAFLQFEMMHAKGPTHREDRISMVDGRKIRWLLVYGTLQYLTSALRAPSAVRDTTSPEYPLCCLVAGQSSWNARTPLTVSSISPASMAGTMSDYFAQESSIQPDCHREDYFAPGNQVRHGVTETTVPFKMHLPLRQPSLRAFAPLASLSPRSSRRNSLTPKPNPSRAIVVQGYGDGVSQPTTASSSAQTASGYRNGPTTSSSSAPGESHQNNEEIPWLKPQAANSPPSQATNDAWERGHTRTRTSLVNALQVEKMATNTESETLNESMSRSDSTSSMGSSVWSNGDSTTSSTSSAGELNFKTSTAEHNGLLGGLVSVDGTRVSLDMPEKRPSTATRSQSNVHPLLREASPQQGGFCFGFGDQIMEPAKQTTDTSGLIGLAISDPPPHMASSSRTTFPPSASPAMLEKNARVSATPVADTTLATDTAPRKKGRSLDIFSGLVTAPSELRDRYNIAMKRSGSLNTKTSQCIDLSNGPKVNVQPPTVTKTSHATKVPSLRERIRHDDGRREWRMSALWQ
jgi:hypothetical protein